MCAVTHVRAQTQLLHADGPLPAFEVVSIKPAQPLPPRPSPPPGEQIIHQQVMRIAPGRGGAQRTDHVQMILNAQDLIASAYDVPFGFEGRRVIGGPDWMRSERYQINAKIDDSQFAAMQKLAPYDQRTQLKLMQEALLADRFKLKVHFETREMPAFELVVAKGGPKLAPATPGERTQLGMLNDTLTATNATLDQWIHSPFMGGRNVINRTGLDGAYDFSLKWSNRTDAADPQDASTSAPSLFTAVQEQLGLKLVPTKAPIEVIVIDHIEQPSEN
jgi:uncharacterized protein (TIGR03435 family)